MYRSLAICGTVKLLLISSSLLCNNALLSFLIPVWALVILPALSASLVAQHGKEVACNVGNPASIPGSGRSPGGGTGNPLPYSWLETSTDRGAWQVTVHGVSHISDTENLCIHSFFLPVWLKVYQFYWSSQRTSFSFNWFFTLLISALYYTYACVCVCVCVCIWVSIGSFLLY